MCSSACRGTTFSERPCRCTMSSHLLSWLANQPNDVSSELFLFLLLARKKLVGSAAALLKIAATMSRTCVAIRHQRIITLSYIANLTINCIWRKDLTPLSTFNYDLSLTIFHYHMSTTKVMMHLVNISSSSRNLIITRGSRQQPLSRMKNTIF